MNSLTSHLTYECGRLDRRGFQSRSTKVSFSNTSRKHCTFPMALSRLSRIRQLETTYLEWSQLTRRLRRSTDVLRFAANYRSAKGCGRPSGCFRPMRLDHPRLIFWRLSVRSQARYL